MNEYEILGTAGQCVWRGVVDQRIDGGIGFDSPVLKRRTVKALLELLRGAQ